MIELHRSRILDTVFSAIWLLASLALLLIPGIDSWGYAGIGVVGVLAWRSWQRLRPVYSRLHLLEDGSVLVERPSGFERVEDISANCVHPWLTVFRLKVEGEPATFMVMTTDSAAPDAYRQLRVCLRWRREVSASADA